jgi:hypothetical protein
MRRLVPVKLADWLDEYRNLPVEEVTRPVSDADDDWEEPDLIASDDRVRDTSPRWLKRAERIGYGRATII